MVFRVSTGDDYDKLEKSIADQNMTIGRLPLNIEGPAGVSLKSMVLENGSTWLCISVKNDSRIIDRLELIIMDQRVAAQFPQPTDSYIFRPIRSISLYRGGEYSVRFTTYEKLGLKQENHRN
ncbi:hypothetical protein LBMAG53_02740 [Planctomycetota bacterium]|nr:hypothetical protein LBMAG53_02740 [Planctomycetota bacterium]